MFKINRPSLVFVVPIFTFILYLCLMSAEFVYERSESQAEALSQTQARIEQHLIRMKYIVESALAIQDTGRIEQEISLAATDLDVMVFTVLYQEGEIRFANHLVWRGSQANYVIDGYEPSIHSKTIKADTPTIQFNPARLSIQAYYPIDNITALEKDQGNIIYLEYDVSPLLSEVKEARFQSAIRSWGVSLLCLAIFLFLLHFYLIRPLRLMAKQAKKASYIVKNNGSFPKWKASPVNVVFSELEAIRNHLINFSDKLERSEKQLRDSQQRWLFAIEVSRNGIWDWNFATGEVFLSDRWKEMLGYSEDELASELSTWENLLHPEDKKDALLTLNQYLNNELDEFESVHRLRHKLGHYIWVLDRGMIVEWDDKGKATRMIGTHADVTSDMRNKQVLLHQAKHDLLTDLPNRSSLLDALYSLNESKQKVSAGLFLIDLDNFKMINDALGHHYGDRLLIQVAARLSSFFATNSLIVRLSADEFVVLAKNLPQDKNSAKRKIHALASQVRQIIGRSFHINNQTFSVSASVGACFIDSQIEIEPELLLKQADVAMHQVKERGRDGYLLYSAEMEEVAQHSLFIESELRGAIAANQLSLVYQPIVDFRGQVVCVEALLRWSHPQMGNIPPSTFIPLAEGSGLIEELGEWILLEACGFINKLHAKGVQLDAVAINVSARQFNQGVFAENLLRVIEGLGVKANSIELELTEYALLSNLDVVKQAMDKLSLAGISIAIDDFGTGYSSLSYLQSIPLSRLKLDATFVSKIDVNESSNAIVKAIIDMAHGLNLKVVAEGVETQAQYDFLLQHGCDSFQGYLFSRPLKEADLVNYIESVAVNGPIAVS
ncbi:putative bifunctional diguanylate cyclase/phosphodiesterase [Shewanella sp. YLB-07]|uniref:putative bifunctional diguanylate cyclase/phosphodiesterase n=1 Tax=Shewanella sp. YLB-07 TaxID=2601268 RepID=UPI001D149EED|nr:EAL domain-containing protein [Shewanella sp. YLB-07]